MMWRHKQRFTRGRLEGADKVFDYSEAERIVEKAMGEVRPGAMILFGSVAKGTANDDGDIDLVLVEESDEQRLVRSARARLVLRGSKVR
jgi:predicted nucleotidyltransferase